MRGTRLISLSSCINISAINPSPKHAVCRFSKTHRHRVVPTISPLIMPLVVPGVTTQSGDKNEEWMNKLAGKKLHDGEESNETVG